MEAKQQAPGDQGNRTGAYRRVEYKGRIFFLSSYQYRIFSRLNNVGPCSTLDLSRTLGIADPRSTIRELRHMGIVVGDAWHKTPDGKRYKRYFLRKEV